MTRSTRLTQDYYDVIFEGYASAMPSPHELRSRVTWQHSETSRGGNWMKILDDIMVIYDLYDLDIKEFGK